MSYSIAFDRALTFRQSALAGAAGPEGARLSPDGTALWAVDAGADEARGLAVYGCSLTVPFSL